MSNDSYVIMINPLEKQPMNNNFFDGTDLIRQVQSELAILSRCFGAIGNREIEKTLFDLSEQLNLGREIIENRYQETLNQATQDAREISGQILAYVLNKA